MDILQDPFFKGVQQMLGAFAKAQIRPVAIKHDQEESMPWDLMKTAQGVGLKQTALIDARAGDAVNGSSSLFWDRT